MSNRKLQQDEDGGSGLDDDLRRKSDSEQLYPSVTAWTSQSLRAETAVLSRERTRYAREGVEDTSDGKHIGENHPSGDHRPPGTIEFHQPDA